MPPKSTALKSRLAFNVATTETFLKPQNIIKRTILEIGRNDLILQTLLLVGITSIYFLGFSIFLSAITKNTSLHLFFRNYFYTPFVLFASILLPFFLMRDSFKEIINKCKQDNAIAAFTTWFFYQDSTTPDTIVEAVIHNGKRLNIATHFMFELHQYINPKDIHDVFSLLLTHPWFITQYAKDPYIQYIVMESMASTYSDKHLIKVLNKKIKENTNISELALFVQHWSNQNNTLRFRIVGK